MAFIWHILHRSVLTYGNSTSYKLNNLLVLMTYN